MKASDTRPSVLEIQESLQSFDWTTLESPGKNKGTRGQMLELALGVPNSSDLKDLVDGELKTYTFGQSIACTQLLHCLPDVVNEVPFKDTKLGRKMEQTIYVGFSKKNEYQATVTLNKETHPEHYLHLEEDYKYICSAITRALQEKTQLATITGPNKLLQIRTKATKSVDGTYKPLVFNGHELKDKGMAFYLCSQFGKHLLF